MKNELKVKFDVLLLAEWDQSCIIFFLNNLSIRILFQLGFDIIHTLMILLNVI